MTRPVWTLQSSSGRSVECLVVPVRSDACSVVIRAGAETIVHECYPDASSALTRATQIQRGLIDSGDWAGGGTRSQS